MPLTPPMMDSPLLSLKEAAPLLGKSLHEVYKLVARSRRAAKGERVKGQTIRFCQDGERGAIRFRPEWVAEYIDRTTVDPSNGNGNGNGNGTPNEKPRYTRGKTGLDWSDLD